MLTQIQARETARELVRQLGRGWKGRVWENLGWHAAAEWNGGYLSPLGGRGMTLYVHFNGGDYFRGRTYSLMAIDRTIGSGRTPLAAVKRGHAWLRERAQEVDRLSAPLFAIAKRKIPTKRQTNVRGGVMPLEVER